MKRISFAGGVAACQAICLVSSLSAGEAQSHVVA